MKTSNTCLIAIVIIVFSACKSNTSENYLPELTYIPFYENEHVVLDNQLILSNHPQTAVILRDYLQNPSGFEEQALPVLIS